MTVYIVIGGNRDFQGVEGVFHSEADAKSMMVEAANRYDAELECNGTTFSTLSENWFISEETVQ